MLRKKILLPSGLHKAKLPPVIKDLFSKLHKEGDIFLINNLFLTLFLNLENDIKCIDLICDKKKVKIIKKYCLKISTSIEQQNNSTGTFIIKFPDDFKLTLHSIPNIIGYVKIHEFLLRKVGNTAFLGFYDFRNDKFVHFLPNLTSSKEGFDLGNSFYQRSQEMHCTCCVNPMIKSLSTQPCQYRIYHGVAYLRTCTGFEWKTSCEINKAIVQGISKDNVIIPLNYNEYKIFHSKVKGCENIKELHYTAQLKKLN
eukprot:Pgem_evm1s13505